jgi:hypothetical protein
MGVIMISRKEFLKYIDYFRSNDFEFCKWEGPEKQEDGDIVMRYPVYDEGVHRFNEEFYDSDLVDGEYFETLEKYNAEASKLTELIETADIKLLKAILTFYIRAERFSEGTWADAIEKKVFLRVLLRLEELVGEEGWDS